MVKNAQPRREAEFSQAEAGPSEAGPSEAGSGTHAIDPGRRQHSRFSVELDVTVSSDHNFYAGFVENMSVGGIFIATHQLKPVGEKLEFSVNLPGVEEPIRGKGEVRWVRVYSEASNVPPGMGIKFGTLPPPARTAIESFLAQREPLFYDED